MELQDYAEVADHVADLIHNAHPLWFTTGPTYIDETKQEVSFLITPFEDAKTTLKVSFSFETDEPF